MDNIKTKTIEFFGEQVNNILFSTSPLGLHIEIKKCDSDKKIAVVNLDEESIKELFIFLKHKDE